MPPWLQNLKYIAPMSAATIVIVLFSLPTTGWRRADGQRGRVRCRTTFSCAPMVFVLPREATLRSTSLIAEGEKLIKLYRHNPA